HTPQWRFDADDEEMNPDRLVLDLDPGEGAGLPDCARVALWCREILEDMGMDTFPVTSGSKGIHLYTALDGSSTPRRSATSPTSSPGRWRPTTPSTSSAT